MFNFEIQSKHFRNIFNLYLKRFSQKNHTDANSMATIYNKVINQMDDRSGYGNSATRFPRNGCRSLGAMPHVRSIIDTILATNQFSNDNPNHI